MKVILFQYFKNILDVRKISDAVINEDIPVIGIIKAEMKKIRG